MAFLSVSVLRLSILLLATLCIFFPSLSASPTDYFNCGRGDDANTPPPLAADCLYIFTHLPGLDFISDTGFLSAHATNTAKPVSLKMSLRPKPLPTHGAIMRHGTCQVSMTLHSFAGASQRWTQYVITPKQAHYLYYPAARMLGRELVEACVVGKKSVGWISKRFQFPGWIDAAVYLKIGRVGAPVGNGRPMLTVFDV